MKEDFSIVTRALKETFWIVEYALEERCFRREDCLVTTTTSGDIVVEYANTDTTTYRVGRDAFRTEAEAVAEVYKTVKARLEWLDEEKDSLDIFRKQLEMYGSKGGL